MDLLYRFLIYLHVLSAIVSIGPFFILLPIVNKLHLTKGKEMDIHLGTFWFVVRMAKHAGHVLVISGILLILLGPWTWRTSWIVMTFMIMFGSVFFLARAFSPRLRKFPETNANKEELAAGLKRSLWMYIVLLLAMLWFMVVKPNFW
ncbi:hypothetical protein JMM81_19155 [Bacillus sp. V3B]|uniref:hypothetical protein n=1 Tax=Bacillus sp. V3B TaxID=2804915 RepID=UPI00210CB347|nr:hypothetical protein [Bacillus sp. V3B]MCQ6276997.1 hypothetical protein [Bacillus sp. V3B]